MCMYIMYFKLNLVQIVFVWQRQHQTKNCTCIAILLNLKTGNSIGQIIDHVTYAYPITIVTQSLSLIIISVIPLEPFYIEVYQE